MTKKHVSSIHFSILSGWDLGNQVSDWNLNLWHFAWHFSEVDANWATDCLDFILVSPFIQRHSNNGYLKGCHVWLFSTLYKKNVFQTLITVSCISFTTQLLVGLSKQNKRGLFFCENNNQNFGNIFSKQSKLPKKT